VVTNINAATQWLLRHEENCLLAEPIPVSLAEAVSRLVEDPELRTKLGEAGFHTVGAYDWESEFGKLWRFVAPGSPANT
jgi:glycosyltransferase involved in cell wall biosynthesis